MNIKHLNARGETPLSNNSVKSTFDGSNIAYKLVDNFFLKLLDL